MKSNSTILLMVTVFVLLFLSSTVEARVVKGVCKYNPYLAYTLQILILFSGISATSECARKGSKLQPREGRHHFKPAGAVDWRNPKFLKDHKWKKGDGEFGREWGT